MPIVIREADPYHRQSEDGRSSDTRDCRHDEGIPHWIVAALFREIEIKSEASIARQQMSLGPSRSAHLLDRAKGIRAEPRSASIRATGDDAAALQGHLLSYIDNAMERFEQRQRSEACQAIYTSQVIEMPRARETYFLMLRWSRSNRVKVNHTLATPEDTPRTNQSGTT